MALLMRRPAPTAQLREGRVYPACRVSITTPCLPEYGGMGRGTALDYDNLRDGSRGTVNYPNKQGRKRKGYRWLYSNLTLQGYVRKREKETLFV